jgi:hypothetical protein
MAANGSALTAGHFWQTAPKVTKKSLPHHSAPRCRSVYPNTGLEPWAAATGHPWPEAANPASLPGYPRFKTCVRPAWFNGAPKIKIKIKIKSESKAGSTPWPVGVVGGYDGADRGVTDASPTLLTPLRSLRQLLQSVGKFTNQVGSQAAALLILILGAPLNHAGRAQILKRGMLFCWRGAGRRVSRTGPWMAHCGGPRFRICVRVHRASARCRVVGQERFGYFRAFRK